jgi:hypothetical protein
MQPAEQKRRAEVRRLHALTGRDYDPAAFAGFVRQLTKKSCLVYTNRRPLRICEGGGGFDIESPAVGSQP